MEIPGKVSLYCPLIDVKGTVGTLVSISDHGYYHVEVPIKGHNPRHAAAHRAHGPLLR